jgi:hypothetical protein
VSSSRQRELRKGESFEDERVLQVALNLRLRKKTCDGCSVGLARPPKVKEEKGAHVVEGSWKVLVVTYGRSVMESNRESSERT